MAWLKTASGAVNLDQIVRADIEGNGSGNVLLYVNHMQYTIASFGSNDEQAKVRVQQLVRAIAPEDI